MKSFSVVGLVFSLIVYCCAQKSILDIPESCPIYITISPLGNTPEESNLIINWGPGCYSPPEWIGLFIENPSISNAAPAYRIDTGYERQGKIKTTTKIDKWHLPDGWDRRSALERGIPPKSNTGPKCMSYYIASYNQSNLIALGCLKIQPNWMRNNKAIINIPLKELFIPGTHCSGCYYNRTQPKTLITKRFGITQNFDIWTQLVMGIRYLNLNIGYYSEYSGVKKFWIMNDNIRVLQLDKVFNDIRKFLKYSNEFIIIHFNEFPLGMYKKPTRHHELIKYIETEFEQFIYRSNLTNFNHSCDLTLHEIWNAGKNIIVLYDQEDLPADNTVVWASWILNSSKFLKADEYREFFKKLYSRGRNSTEGHIFIGIQGIESAYEPSEPLQTIRERANNINQEITNLIGGPWSFNVNIIAIDYFMSTNLIDIGVYRNQLKNLQFIN